MDELEQKLETILVVDDTPSVLLVVTAILRQANFNVLEAASGQQALTLAARFPGKIHLLLSDIQMPAMNGPSLGEALKALRPDIRVMLMSGMAGGSILLLNYGWTFIEKPFLTDKLLEMVTAVLHSPDKSQGSRQYDARE